MVKLADARILRERMLGEAEEIYEKMRSLESGSKEKSDAEYRYEKIGKKIHDIAIHEGALKSEIQKAVNLKNMF